jgi:hypothetical protein
MKSIQSFQPQKKPIYELQSLNELATQTLMRAPFIHNTFRVGDFWSYTDTQVDVIFVMHLKL